MLRRGLWGCWGRSRWGSWGAIPAARAQEVTLSVAISMKDAVEELGRGFAARHPGVQLRYNFGSSGELQKQIEAGAPIDLFVSAAQRQMDELDQKGLIVRDTRRVFARNVLTVIKPADSRLDLAKPAGPARRPGRPDRDRQPEDGAGGPVRGGEPARPRALGPSPAEARPRRERPPGARVRGAGRGRRWLRLHDRRRGAGRPRQGGLPPGRGDVPAGPLPGGGGGEREAARPRRGRSSSSWRAPEGQAVLARLGFQPPPPGVR